MPTIPEIRTSIENQSLLIRDPHAKKGQFLRDARGRLISYSGGFTVVYPYTLKGEKWAFRCWHAHMGDVRNRFEKISKAIYSSKANYLCDFVYIDNGVVVNGKVNPTTRMKWVEGMTLKNYLCTHKNSKTKLTHLAANFLHLIKDMHHRKFAHGDLQHGNIIVNEKGELFLVDYDSFYCPELKGAADIIHGLPDYQHPLRKLNKLASEKLDYFSELIIYLSILGIAERATLLDKYKVADSEHLLFTADDFKQLQQSAIYKDMYGLSNEIDKLLLILISYLKENNLSNLKPFNEHLDKNKKMTRKITVKSPKTIKQSPTSIEEATSEVLLHLENSHFCYKGIPIKGTVADMTNHFLKLGGFVRTTKYEASLVGELFGLPKVYVQFEFSYSYLNVIAIHFFIYNRDCDITTVYLDFKKALNEKYKVIGDLSSNSVQFAADNGTVTLKKTQHKLEITYADDLTIYEKIKAEKTKIARSKYLEGLKRDI